MYTFYSIIIPAIQATIHVTYLISNALTICIAKLNFRPWKNLEYNIVVYIDSIAISVHEKVILSAIRKPPPSHVDNILYTLSIGWKSNKKISKTRACPGKTKEEHVQ